MPVAIGSGTFLSTRKDIRYGTFQHRMTTALARYAVSCFDPPSMLRTPEKSALRQAILLPSYPVDRCYTRGSSSRLPVSRHRFFHLNVHSALPQRRRQHRRYSPSRGDLRPLNSAKRSEAVVKPHRECIQTLEHERHIL